MTKQQAGQAVQEQWLQASARTVQPLRRGARLGPPVPVAKLGHSLDVEATARALPMDSLWSRALRSVGLMPAHRSALPPKLRLEPGLADGLAATVRAQLGVARPARALWKGGKVVLEPEEPGSALDVAALREPVAEALEGATEFEVPLRSAEPTVSDEELARIDGVLGTFTTSFSEGNRPRASNIRTAVRNLDGIVVPPGGKLSFNGTLGQRTTAKGYRVAGVYVSGRHEEDVGGGICQVSTTLFNAALIGGLDAPERSPHSLPVPYVPLGRDAAVSYPKPNLVLQNPYDFPVAVSGSVGKGKVTFTVLGSKSSKPKVQLSQRHLASWSRGVKYVEDKSLPPGAQRVEDRGGMGHRASTTRVLTLANGETRTDTFESVYGGGPRIVRINRSPRPAKPAARPPAAQTQPPPPATAPAVPPPSGP
jgi:vancomycin resistance protein YoaR